jgi:hypothetical protein
MAVALRIMAAHDAGDVALGEFGPLLHSALARENPGAVNVPQPQPVDVLAVMRSDATEAKVARERAGSPHTDALAAESAEARAAVAELVREVTLMLEAAPTTASAREYYEARVRDALARVGGAA